MLLFLIFSFVGCKEKNTETQCYNCGKTVSDNIAFCGFCGADLTSKADSSNIENNNIEIEQEASSVVETSEPNKSSQPTKPNISSNKTETNKNTCFYAECTNKVNGYGQYCSNHVCKKSGCNKPKSFSIDYCSSHKCFSAGCNNPKEDLGSYCEEHTCVKSGCNRQKSLSYD